MINNLQFTMHTPLLDINFPANANLVFNFIISIVTFDVFPSEDALNQIFQFPEASPYNERFDEIGYGSTNIIFNLGSNNFFIWIFFSFAFMTFAIYPLRNKS